jgi:hypothetical protein
MSTLFVGNLHSFLHLLGQGQNLRTLWRDRYGMLKVRTQRTIRHDDRPQVV